MLKAARRLLREHVRLIYPSGAFMLKITNPLFFLYSPYQVNYLSAMTSIAALQSWICMLITYLCWYRGARIAMRDRPGFKDTEEAKFIRNHKGFCQPYVSDSKTGVRWSFCKDKMLTLR